MLVYFFHRAAESSKTSKPFSLEASADFVRIFEQKYHLETAIACEIDKKPFYTHIKIFHRLHVSAAGEMNLPSPPAVHKGITLCIETKRGNITQPLEQLKMQ